MWFQKHLQNNQETLGLVQLLHSRKHSGKILWKRSVKYSTGLKALTITTYKNKKEKNLQSIKLHPAKTGNYT